MNCIKRETDTRYIQSEVVQLIIIFSVLVHLASRVIILLPVIRHQTNGGVI